MDGKLFCVLLQNFIQTQQFAETVTPMRLSQCQYMVTNLTVTILYTNLNSTVKRIMCALILYQDIIILFVFDVVWL